MALKAFSGFHRGQRWHKAKLGLGRKLWLLKESVEMGDFFDHVVPKKKESRRNREDFSPQKIVLLSQEPV